MLRCVLFVLVFACAGALGAGTTLRLPAGTCAGDEAIFFDGFEGMVAVPSDPSFGAGGAAPGRVIGTVVVPGLGSAAGVQTYFVYVPSAYVPSRAWPLLIALHGASGSAALAVDDARRTRDDWAALAEEQGFVVVVPVGNHPAGSWIVPPQNGPTDYDGFAAIRDQVAAEYNIERTRMYLWGFSAGGHVAFDLVFNASSYATPLNESNLAGMAVSAGAMSQFACNGAVPGKCAGLAAALPRQLPIDIHIGTLDWLYKFAAYDRTILIDAGWREGSTLGYHVFADGHRYDPPHLAEAWGFMCRYARGP